MTEEKNIWFSSISHPRVLKFSLLLIETLMEEVKPTVFKKIDFKECDISKILSIFVNWHFQDSDALIKISNSSIELSCWSVELSIESLMEDFKFVVLEASEFEDRDLSSVLATFWSYSDSQDSKTQKVFAETNFLEKNKLVNRDIWSLEEEWSTKYWIKWNWISGDNSFDGTFWHFSGARLVTEEKKFLFYNVCPPQL